MLAIAAIKNLVMFSPGKRGSHEPSAAVSVKVHGCPQSLRQRGAREKPAAGSGRNRRAFLVRARSAALEAAFGKVEIVALRVGGAQLRIGAVGGPRRRTDHFPALHARRD